ncbi:MAG: glycosyltransferase [Thermodesulfovibrionales bacterium]
MKLSVIIPCFNAADTIATQLEALANQYWSEPWEIIVADNGSTDNSVDIVMRYKDLLSNLRIVDASDKGGQAHAKNIGARNARGVSLAFCDADDEVAPGWVAKMGEALSKYDFVACRMEIKKLNPPWVLKSRNNPQESSVQKYKYPPYLPHAGGSTIGVKRWIHDAIGGFDESMIFLEDTDYCWRIQLKGIELHFIPEAVIHIRFKNKIKDIYMQAGKWGEYNVKIYKRYLPYGMQKLTWRQGVISWKNLLKNFIKDIPNIRDKGDIAKWAWQFGWRLGRVKGSIKHRVFAL